MMFVTFSDPGMLSKTVEIGDSELSKALEAEALKMNYTRAHVERPGSPCPRWGKVEGVTFVRALGHREWRDWALMSSTERHQWREQDKGE